MTDLTFDKEYNRRGTNSYKWDTAQEDDILPLWVADMDFQTAPCITAALADKVKQGIFGYTKVPEAYYEATRRWFSERHGLNVDRRHILYTSGVVPAISATIKALTLPGEGVIVQTPVYNCFFSSIRNNGCRIVENQLIYNDGRYAMDFEDLERLASEENNTLMLLCNPHNPAGRVWSRDELEMVNEICRRHNVRVISDEIHCELTFAGNRYTPFASLSAEAYANSVSFTSPSKAFNTAGLQIANIFAADDEVRRRIDRAININEVCDVNPFGVIALIKAYNEGGPWLEALKDYLWDNYLTLRNYFEENLPQLTVTKLEGTYLAWIDCRALGMSDEELFSLLYDKGRVWVAEGGEYGSAGRGFIRINMACPRSRLIEGLRRINEVLK